MKKFLFLVSILVNIESFAGTTENINSSAKTIENINSSAKTIENINSSAKTTENTDNSQITPPLVPFLVYSDFLEKAEVIDSEKGEDIKYLHPLCGVGYCTVRVETYKSNKILKKQFPNAFLLLTTLNSLGEPLFTAVYLNKFEDTNLNPKRHLIITYSRVMQNPFKLKGDIIYTVIDELEEIAEDFAYEDQEKSFKHAWCKLNNGVADKKTDVCSVKLDD